MGRVANIETMGKVRLGGSGLGGQGGLLLATISLRAWHTLLELVALTGDHLPPASDGMAGWSLL